MAFAAPGALSKINRGYHDNFGNHDKRDRESHGDGAASGRHHSRNASRYHDLRSGSDEGASKFEIESGAFERRLVWQELQRDRGVQLWDDVALLEEMPAEDVTTGELLLLRRGQMGRVMMTYDARESQVQFSTRHAHIFAKLRIPNDV